jgi:hypothetical protein
MATPPEGCAEPVKSDELWAGVCLLGVVHVIFRS